MLLLHLLVPAILAYLSLYLSAMPFTCLQYLLFVCNTVYLSAMPFTSLQCLVRLFSRSTCVTNSVNIRTVTHQGWSENPFNWQFYYENLKLKKEKEEEEYRSKKCFKGLANHVSLQGSGVSGQYQGRNTASVSTR